MQEQAFELKRTVSAFIIAEKQDTWLPTSPVPNTETESLRTVVSHIRDNQRVLTIEIGVQIIKDIYKPPL